MRNFVREGGIARQTFCGKQYYYTKLKTANWKIQIKIILVPTSYQQSILSSESRKAYASNIVLHGSPYHSLGEKLRNKVFPHLNLLITET